jgi:hypothetical protein
MTPGRPRASRILACNSRILPALPNADRRSRRAGSRGRCRLLSPKQRAGPETGGLVLVAGAYQMKPTKAQIAAFIRDHAVELRKLAVQAKLRVLAILIEMVILEADAFAKRPTRRRRGR